MTCRCEACLWEAERDDEAFERVAGADPGPERDEAWWSLVLAWEPAGDGEGDDGWACGRGELAVRGVRTQGR